MIVEIFPTYVDISWHDDAACAYIGGDTWFPEKGESNTDAKRICRGCLVRAECLDYALTTGERFGIFGGLSWTQRRRLLAMPAPAVDHLHGAAA